MMKNIAIFIMLFVCLSFASSQAWDTLVPSGDIPSARYGHSLIKVSSGIYIFGGRSSDTYYQNHYVYNINEEEFDLITPESGNEVPSARYGHAAVYYSGKIYIFGGMGASNTLSVMNDIWSYNISTNLWAKENGTVDIGDLPVGRYDHQALVLDGVVYISGGYNASDADVSQEFWTYTLSTKKWQQKGNMRATRYGHSMFMDLSSRLHVYAGKGEPQLYADALLNTMERYNSANDTWDYVEATNPPIARMSHATVYSNDMLWVIGGRTDPTRVEGETNEFWYFDMANATWTKKENGPTLSNLGAAILEKSGTYIKIFVFGGKNANVATQQVWQYDSSADNDDDDDDDDGGGNSISCGATGIEFLFFFLLVFVWRSFQKKS